jgi:hypothetical protein
LWYSIIRKREQHPDNKGEKIMKKYYCYNCYGVWIGTRTLEEIEKWNAQPLPASKKIKYWDEV